jgi:hypothetical protein
LEAGPGQKRETQSINQSINITKKDCCQGYLSIYLSIIYVSISKNEGLSSKPENNQIQLKLDVHSLSAMFQLKHS